MTALQFVEEDVRARSLLPVADLGVLGTACIAGVWQAGLPARMRRVVN